MKSLSKIILSVVFSLICVFSGIVINDTNDFSKTSLEETTQVNFSPEDLESDEEDKQTIPDYVLDETKYTRLDYIQGIGKQYIDTGIVASNDYSIELDCEDYSQNISNLYGATEGFNYYIFAKNNKGTTNYITQRFKLKGFRVFDIDGQCIQNLIPCLNEEKKAGMYDTVNDIFLKNAGTGNFIYSRANEKLPTGYTKTKYILNTSGYIDTGIQAKYSHNVMIDYNFVNDCAVWGINDSTNNVKYNLYYNGGNEHPNTLVGYATKGGTYTLKANDYIYGMTYSRPYIDERTLLVYQSGYCFEYNSFEKRGYNHQNNAFDSTLSSNLNYYLFAYNKDGKATQFQAKRSLFLYEYALFDEDGVCLQHLIPCINSQGIAGLYDLMADDGEQVFFTSVNGEEFLTDNHAIECENNITIKDWSEKYDEYIKDNTIVLEGDGTESNPYLVSNVYEFIYAGKLKKSLKITQDIYLNDGYFLDDKYIDGGDGVLYNWDVAIGFSCKIFGDSHTLYGLYSNIRGLFVTASKINDLCLDKLYVNVQDGGYIGGLVRCGYGNSFTSIKVNGTVNGIYSIGVGGLSGYSGSFKNCKNEANVVGTNYVGGICGNRGHYENCDNYGKISGKDRVGGIAGATAERTKTITNCNNYGKVSGSGNVGGFAGQVGSYSEPISNCNNYGDVYSTTVASGFAGYIYNTSDSAFINCKNYGTIEGGSVASGIWSSGGYAPKVIDCVNYGKIISSKGAAYGLSCWANLMQNCFNFGKIIAQGNAVGLIGGAGFGRTHECLVSNCKNYGDVTSKEKNATGVADLANPSVRLVNCMNFGTICGYNRASGILGCLSSDGYGVIEKCINKGKVISGAVSGGICAITTVTKKEVQFIDCANEGNVSSSSYAAGIIGSGHGWAGGTYSFYNCMNSGTIDSKYAGAIISNQSRTALKIKNCLNTGDMPTATGGYLQLGAIGNSSTGYSITIENFICKGLLNGKEVKQYYGTNFRDFYVSWKYGTIGLKPLDGYGVGQGAVTTTWLNETGWVKKG